jgi:hypothetical protein
MATAFLNGRSLLSMAGSSYLRPQLASVAELPVFLIKSAVARRGTTLAFVLPQGGHTPMLETLAVLLLLFWALGLVTSYTLSGFIHILLVAAVVVVLVRVIQGRRPI